MTSYINFLNINLSYWQKLFGRFMMARPALASLDNQLDKTEWQFMQPWSDMLATTCLFVGCFFLIFNLKGEICCFKLVRKGKVIHDDKISFNCNYKADSLFELGSIPSSHKEFSQHI